MATLSSSIRLAWRGLHFTSRAVLVAAVLAALLAGSALLTLRYWVLPNADNLRAFVVEEVERRIGRRITVGALEVNWAGLRPDLTFSDVHVFDERGFPVLTMDSVHAVLSWRSLAVLEPRARFLVIEGPHLTVKRSPEGRLYVAGISMPEGAAAQAVEAQSGNWLLRQEVVAVKNARITWEDEQRGAPPLTLERVELRLENRGSRHRGALRGAAPPGLGGHLDLRADLQAVDPADWRQVSGEIYLALDAVALEAWDPWIDLPLELTRGRGAVRGWLNIRDGRPIRSTLDASLAGVVLRLAPELPVLDVTTLDGRVSWREDADEWEIGADDLRLETSDGIRIGPLDMALARRAGGSGRPPAVSFTANAIDLAALAALAERLPLGADLRARLAALAPEGRLADVVAAWEGELPAPATYRVRARFENLHLKPLDLAPGFHGVSGEVDGNERHGRFGVDGAASELAMPKIFAAPIRFDSLSIRGAWSKVGDTTEVTLRKVAFANGDIAGSVTGTYQTSPAGPGAANLSGSLTRADARAIYRYLPLEVSAQAREWLRTSLLGGRAVDTRFTLKGDLDRFPFTDDQEGLFEVTTRAVGVELSYADEWPAIRELGGDLLFRGPAMRITGATGSILGVRLAGVSAVIPDLDADDPVLSVEGTAEGETQAFLRFIAQSPVDRYIGGYTRDIAAAGSGRLDLALTVPVERTDDTKVRGSYRFLSNRIVVRKEMPALEEVSGALGFTQSEVKADALRGQFVGGPFKLSASTSEGVVRLEASGRANLDAWKARENFAWARHLAGATDWRITQEERVGGTALTLRSSLQGLALTLPAPLTKGPDSALPLTLERKRTAEREMLSATLGSLVSLQASGRVAADGVTMENAAVMFGGDTAQANRAGLWIGGKVQAVDIDAWRAVIGAEQQQTDLPLRGVDLTAKNVFLFNRLFRDLQIKGQVRDGTLQLAVDGRELAGDLAWDAAGQGALKARLVRLQIPSADTLGRSTQVAPPPTRSLPALDVVADDFALGDRPMGRLELAARNEGEYWRVNKLELRHPDSVISADGQWSGRQGPPLTRLNVKLDAVDLGGFLARVGIGQGMRGGTGSAGGRIEWAGNPFQVDYPTLGGTLALDFREGRFEEVNPGAARLLGVLSVSALPRRLGGDFEDIFGKGLVFQQISGDVRLARGVARTENLTVASPSVRVVMNGEVDLVREAQNLRLRVTPEMSGTTALATGILGGPVVGLAALAVSKLFRDPIGQMAALEYNVSGSWTDPQVTRLSRGQTQEQQ
ncbi:MAG TPA: YhdP family protein [Pelomicrobium sp.]|nr:YhdP family protein [Pelomicrobium sp.]